MVKAVMVGGSGGVILEVTPELKMATAVSGPVERSWYVGVEQVRSAGVWGLGEPVGWGETCG